MTIQIKRRVADILLLIGIMPSLDGYNYIIYGVCCCVENPVLIKRMTRVLYPKIAQEFDRTPSQVERSIRTALESGWNSGKFLRLNDIFCVNVIDSKDKEKLRNCEFIALLADRLLFQLAEESGENCV